MKTKILTLAFAMTMGSSALGSDQTLDMGGIANLNVNKNEVVVSINYPGPGGNNSICGVKTVTSKFVLHKKVNLLKDALLVEEGWDFTGNQVELDGKIKGSFGPTVGYNLTQLGTFVTHVRISTRSGESLKKVLSEILETNHDSIVGIVTSACGEK